MTDEERLARDYAYSRMILIERQRTEALEARDAAKNRKRSADADARAAKVAKMTAKGMTNEQIAKALDVTTRTVQRLRKR